MGSNQLFTILFQNIKRPNWSKILKEEEENRHSLIDKKINYWESHCKSEIKCTENFDEIKNDIGITTSHQTIRNILHHASFKSAYVKKKPFISKKNQKKRLQFLRSHINKDSSFWNSIIWSDESSLECLDVMEEWKSGENPENPSNWRIWIQLSSMEVVALWFGAVCPQ